MYLLAPSRVYSLTGPEWACSRRAREQFRALPDLSGAEGYAFLAGRNGVRGTCRCNRSRLAPVTVDPIEG